MSTQDVYAGDIGMNIHDDIHAPNGVSSGIIAVILASLTTFAAFLKDIQWGAVNTVILLLFGTIAASYWGWKWKAIEFARKVREESNRQREEDLAFIRAKAQADADADSTLGHTRDRKIAELQSIVTGFAAKEAEWRERLHEQRNLTMEKDSRIAIQDRRIEMLEASLYKVKDSAYTTAHNANMISEAAGVISESTHVPVNLPAPLDTSEIAQINPKPDPADHPSE